MYLERQLGDHSCCTIPYWVYSNNADTILQHTKVKLQVHRVLCHQYPTLIGQLLRGASSGIGDGDTVGRKGRASGTIRVNGATQEIMKDELLNSTLTLATVSSTPACGYKEV